MARKLTDEQIKEICRLYKNGIKSPELGRMFNAHSKTIRNYLGIKKEKKSVAEGNKFGRWLVIEEAVRRGYDQYFLCECSCPDRTRREVLLYSLLNGSSQSCGCLTKENGTRLNTGKNYTGVIFGELTVLYEIERNKHGHRQVMARCSCDGNIDDYSLVNLRNKHTLSCGCHNLERIKEVMTFRKKDYEEKHPFFCEIEEIRDCKNEPGIEVVCKHCKEWFKPSHGQIVRRIMALEKSEDFSPGTEMNFYCSEKCKQECDTYHAQKTPKSLRNVVKRSRCNQKINRKALLDLQIDECGYNYCEKCGKRFDKGDLALHHNIMVSLDPGMADDMSHQLLCCVEHHDHKGC